jgi:hypothetical protein
VSDWRELYKGTAFETNPTNIEQRIAETEVALFVRLLELGTNTDAGDERREVDAATKVLATLKQRREKRASPFNFGSDDM